MEETQAQQEPSDLTRLFASMEDGRMDQLGDSLDRAAIQVLQRKIARAERDQKWEEADKLRLELRQKLGERHGTS